MGARLRGIQKDRVIERIVKDGVRDETARIIRLSGRRVGFDWITGAGADGIVVYRNSLELVGLERLDIASMILIEIREAVIEENRRVHILRDVEIQDTLCGRVIHRRFKVAWIVGIIETLPHPCCRDGTIAAERP
jgi:hypothetical protein